MTKFGKRYLILSFIWFLLFEFAIWTWVEPVNLHPFAEGNIIFLLFAGGLTLMFTGIWGFIEGKFSKRGY